MTTWIVGASVIAVVVLIAIGYQVYALRGWVLSLEERLAELEKGPKRHTHSTIAGLENATAVLIDALFEAEALRARIDTARRLIGKTREGPYAFDEDEEYGHKGS